MSSDRFRDVSVGYFFWGQPVLVVCPSCSECALSIPLSRLWDGQVPPFTTETFEAHQEWLRLTRARRVACGSCAYSRETRSRTVVDPSAALDPHFGLPLWLVTPCVGETMWAWNEEHLHVLTGYIGAKHRERSPFLDG